METVEKKRNTKYSILSDLEKKEKYNELSRDWYSRKTRDEKKAIIIKHYGMCDICKNNHVYANLYEHRKTKIHIKNLEKCTNTT